MTSEHNIHTTSNVNTLQLRDALTQLLNLLPQYPSHLTCYLRTFLIVQIVALAPSKHRPAPALDLWHCGWSRYYVEMYMRYDLCCSRAVVLYDVVVSYTSNFRYSASE